MYSRTRYLLVVIAALWVMQYAQLGAYPRSCSVLCTSSADCNTLCYVNLNDFINDITATCLDYGVYDEENCPTGSVAGDGTAGSGEGRTCGNAVCNENETCFTCPSDCGQQQCGYCGDNTCSVSEYGGGGSGNPPQCAPYSTWCSYCEDDCGGCNEYYCHPYVCGGDSTGHDYQCVPCTNSSQCVYTDHQCMPWGQCEEPPTCQQPSDCSYLGSGWTCSSEQKCVRTT